MSADAQMATTALNLRFLLDFPREAARKIERFSAEAAAELLQNLPLHAVVPVWGYLAADIEESVLGHLPEAVQRHLLTEQDPARCASLLQRLDEDTRQRYLALLSSQVRAELVELMRYPPGSAGQLMSPRVITLRPGQTVAEALVRLRRMRSRGLREIYLVDADEHLVGRVEIQDLALAEAEDSLASLKRPIIAAAGMLAPREELVELIQRHGVADLPVVDPAGSLLGVLNHAQLVSAMQQEASLDIQTMVGVSKDETANSRAGFAVIKRLPWLQVNLLTAFLAASVVGLFENTIAQFTALAVLMPVVAGQAGNTGAQALAVTMRGLFLHEVTLRHWRRVLFKEASVGFLNGVAVAATTALAVYVWSRSPGLSLVIGSSMVISMVIAGLAGAMVPMLLRRVGLDPAQSSSIILTTVTDVAGFFSFLGIATLLSGMLTPG